MPSPNTVYRHVNSHARLTKSEQATLELLQKGLTVDEISLLLNVKRETVKNRVRMIQEKIDDQAEKD